MRFQVQETRWRHATYTIHLGDVIIPVRNPPLLRQLRGRERMVFAWPDSGECVIRGLNPPDGAVEILSPEGKICSGLPVAPRLRKKLARPAVFLWHIEDRVIVCEARRMCCRAFFPVEVVLALREWDGRRLATWLKYAPRRGTLRGDLPEDMKPLILGMVLSSMYDWLWD